jgi:hypothetical protein
VSGLHLCLPVVSESCVDLLRADFLGFARLPVMKAIWRAVIEVSFIVFLFYSNLLMGEFERSGKGQEMGLAWAVSDIVTPPNFAIAIAAALIGYVVVEFLRSKILSGSGR